jgi:hypothetical protein
VTAHVAGRQMLCALELLRARPRARLSLAQLRKIEAALADIISTGGALPKVRPCRGCVMHGFIHALMPTFSMSSLALRSCGGLECHQFC